jgi:phosphatidylserine/phosphatidylglycerophosphate/cardiolipin synthase-like enzyme
MVLVGCSPVPATGNGSLSPGEEYAEGTGAQDGQSDWYQAYFTDPGSPQSETLRGGPDTALADALRGARLSIDMAVDSFNLWSLREALIAAQRSGVPVRVLVEGDRLDTPEVQDLAAAGIAVVSDQNSGLMHNKYAIIDHFEVWSGSMNFTLNGAYRNNNNLIRIRSAQLAEDYLVEFDEMFVDHQFGPASPADTPLPIIEVEGAQIEAYFSPEDEPINRMIQLVEAAQDEVLFMAYSFTDDDLARAMLEKAGEGVHVAGVLEESQARNNIGGEYLNFLEHGVDVRLDGNPAGMHHKVIIIDGRTVITGSYNFSNNARTRNDDNTLILHNPQIAALYEQEFERVWKVAEVSP